MLLRNNCYFCANLRRKVEIAKIVIVVLIALVGLYSEVGKRRKKAAVKRPEKVASSAPVVPDAAVRLPGRAGTPPPVDVSPATALPDEGVRVTDADLPPMELADDDGVLDDGEAEELRRAIITGEILARKF